nr:GIY-YIG nuclease family protein [uncultured Acetatifactor sp.]
MTLYEILGITPKKELSKLNIEKIKLNQPELYDLIQEFTEEKRKQYNLFKNIMDFVDKDLFYRMYLEDKNNHTEYVYFIKNDTTGLIKIGMTTNPHDRLSSISSTLKTATGIEHNLRFIGIIYMTSSCMKDYESALHKKYEQYRKYGEWFDISEKEIINTYFIDSFNVDGIRLDIEEDNRCIPLNYINEEVPDDLFRLIVMYQIMDKCKYKHSSLVIENEYVNMMMYYNPKKIIDIIQYGCYKRYIEYILEKTCRVV